MGGGGGGGGGGVPPVTLSLETTVFRITHHPNENYNVLYRLPFILDSCIHDDYHEALKHQMGLLTDQKARNKVEYNNAVEESSLVHIDSEQSSKSLEVNFCTPKTFPALDIPKVHELVPRCFSVSPKYSHLLMLIAVQVENDWFITLHFACVILSVAYTHPNCI